MHDKDLETWVSYWADQYPRNWDDKIGDLAGKEAFSHADVACVYEWKFQRLWPKRNVDRMMELPEERVLDFSRRAFGCPDELGALTIMTLIPGAAAAGASALLTAHDPVHYTVMDVRAIRSLTALGLWSEQQGTGASCFTWLEYLDTCRNLARRTGQPLRRVDRALWSARGRT